MSRKRVVVFDYGFGNVHSVVKALEAAGAEVALTADADKALTADGLLVPGVGSFSAVMAELEAADGPRIIDQRLAGGKPVMGICVGMQVLFGRGYEGADESESERPIGEPEATERVHAKNADEFWWSEDATDLLPGTPGLEQWPGTVRRLQAPRLPHIGWNTVEAAPGSTLFNGIEQERFYFVHSYAATELPLDDEIPGAPPVLCTHSTFGERFIAAVENGPLTATQFHPEKSGAAGIQLLRNWLDTL